MALLLSHPTHVLVRWFHLLGMAVLLGGAALVWTVLRRDPTHAAAEASTAVLRSAAAYEWLFWGGAGLLVLTGVGNLGALAPTIPGPATTWGTSFATKLLGVVVLLVGSLVRTLGVIRLLGRDPSQLAPTTVGRLRGGYAATALLLLVVVGLAEVLAHG